MTVPATVIQEEVRRFRYAKTPDSVVYLTIDYLYLRGYVSIASL